MGVYLYTIRKKTVEATMLPENKNVVVALATFTTKVNRSMFNKHDPYYKEYFRIRAYMTKAQTIVNKGFKPDYYTTDFKQGHAYLFNGIATVDDTPDMGILCGVMAFRNKKYYIIPYGKKLQDFNI